MCEYLILSVYHCNTSISVERLSVEPLKLLKVQHAAADHYQVFVSWCLSVCEKGKGGRECYVGNMREC